MAVHEPITAPGDAAHRSAPGDAAHRSAPGDAAHRSAPGDAAQRVCPLYHQAVEIVGRRWTGAILAALMDGPLRFSEVAAGIPELSDRLLSERMKELEARGLVTREVIPGPPLQVRYGLSRMGHELEPALTELQRWAHRWLSCS
jgi:DNA-binding HxlR family transcriptional regulator